MKRSFLRKIARKFFKVDEAQALQSLLGLAAFVALVLWMCGQVQPD